LPPDVLLAALPPESAVSDLAKRFDRSYADRLHPLCDRRIAVDATELLTGSKSSTTFFKAHISANDVGPPGIGATTKVACDDDSIERYGLREWSLMARISDDGERVDAGDGIHGALLDLERLASLGSAPCLLRALAFTSPLCSRLCPGVASRLRSRPVARERFGGWRRRLGRNSMEGRQPVDCSVAQHVSGGMWLLVSWIRDS
jgi:hypothetical protein